MALNFMDGLDYASTSAHVIGPGKWDDASWVTSVTTANTRFNSGRGCVLNSVGRYLEIDPANIGTSDAIVVGFALQFSLRSSDAVILQFGDGDITGGNLMGSVSVEAITGNLLYKRDTTVVLTSTINLVNGAWHYIEVKVLFDNANGTIAFQIDGVDAGSASSQDTLHNGTECDTLRLAGTVTTHNVDDIYIGDTSGAFDFLGDTRIVSLFPNGDNSVQFSSTGGNNFGVIDEVPLNEGDYVESNTATHVDLYDFASFGVSGSDTIHGVVANMWYEKVESGATNMRIVVFSGSTQYESADITAVVGFQRGGFMWILDPDTSMAWTNTLLDLAEFGFERQ